MPVNKNVKTTDKSILEMQQALLGIASQEASVLGDLKACLDSLLNQTYTETREYQKVAVQEAMISEQTITQVDGAAIEGIDRVSKELNAKNQEIKKLKRLLALLGLEVTPASSQILDSLSQTLEEWNKRNKILRSIQSRLIQHLGQIPPGVVPQDTKRILVKLNDEIKKLYQTNFDLKQQLKLERLQSLQESKESTPKDTPFSPRRGPK